MQSVTIDFNNDKIGQPPGGFSTALTGRGQTGKWVVMKDDASPDRGNVLAQTDADDLFYDAEKKLVYVSCGEGAIDVFAERDPDHYQEVVRIPTAPGARTSLWVPELNQLFLATPSRGGQQAAVRIYRRD